jgi:hypothetical protein
LPGRLGAGLALAMAGLLAAQRAGAAKAPAAAATPAAATTSAAAATSAATPAAATAPAAAAPARLVEVRLALSGPAAVRLSELRVRRLLEIELEESAVLAPGASGPLGDHVAYVWIDQPSSAQVVIEVKVGDRPIAHREIRVAGLAGDVAARLVAIAVSEMVRAQIQPIRVPPRRAPAPRRPTAEELEIASRALPAVFLTPAASVAVLPADGAFVAGPALSLGFRAFGASESLFARWLTGAGRAGGTRWLEAGVAADYRLWLHPSWRLALGGAASLASLHLSDARIQGNAPGEQETWSARAGAVVGVESRINSWTWFSVALDPAVILRPVRYDGTAGEGAVQGVWLGINVGLTLERVQRAGNGGGAS